MTELMTRFGTVDVMFFDGGETMRDENSQSLQELCMEIAWDHNPDLLITRGAVPTPEQQLPGIGADMAWEACLTLGTAWQYQPTNETYKTGLHAIRLLTETRAKGGSLLLNIGPDANGESAGNRKIFSERLPYGSSSTVKPFWTAVHGS